MSVLILKNVHNEGPGTISGYLGEHGISYGIVEPDEAIEEDSIKGARALVVMGGPMGVYEADDYPQLQRGMKLMELALKRKLPVLGICLGSQMLAEVLGAEVRVGDAGQEVGWYGIKLTPDGIKDSSLGAFGQGEEGPHTVFHFHGDTFDIPKGAVRLAGSEMYENQAFRYGENAYGLQFHIEVTRDMVSDWMKDIPGGEEAVRQCSEYMGQFEEAGRRFYSGFFGS